MNTVIIKGNVIGKGNKPLPIDEPHKCATVEEAERLVSLGVAEWPEEAPQSSPPERRDQIILSAVKDMLATDPKKKNKNFWDKEGKPLVHQVRKLSNLSDVSGEERDDAWFALPESKPTPPEGLTEERIAIIKSAIEAMMAEDPEMANKAFWTGSGKPTDKELDKRIEGGVTAAERDWVFEQVIGG